MKTNNTITGFSLTVLAGGNWISQVGKTFWTQSLYSWAPVDLMVTKWRTITIGTEPHASITLQTHAIFFSWSTWLVAWIATWRPYFSSCQVMQSWFTTCIFDIGHLCYSSFTPVKTRYLLNTIMRWYHRLKFRAHRGHVFFFKSTADQVLVFDWMAGSCEVNLL